MAKTSTKKNKVETDRSRQLQREHSRESMRRLREKIKNDPVLYEESKRKEKERYLARKVTGKIKKIDQMSTREKRKTRKEWRARSKKSYDKKKGDQQLERDLRENTPPASPIMFQPIIPIPAGSQENLSRQAIQGKLIQRRNRESLKKEIKFLRERLLEKDRKLAKYKKKVQRIKKKQPDSPNKKVTNMLKGQQVTPEVKRSLVFSEAIQQQLKSNFKQNKSHLDKRSFTSTISGDIIKKYRFKCLLGSSTSRRLLLKNGKNNDLSKKRQNVAQKVKQAVKNFFEKDLISRLCPGKKDTVTFHKVKKQKRYLNGTLFSTYIQFKKFHPLIKISYQTFCNFRPFWVLKPNARLRDTCLCMLHDNMTLLTAKAKTYDLIETKDPEELSRQICCDKKNDDCINRSCPICQSKSIRINKYENNDIVSYEKWYSKKVEIEIKGKKKMCQKTVKEPVECSKQEMVDHLKKSLTRFMVHLRNISHQYSSVDTIKKSLTLNEALFHIDFSENYNCKYAKEIQSAHFGGSKPQVTLHTVVMYYLSTNTNGEELVKPMSLCTFSDNMRHDPAAICAHLEPVIKEALEIVPKLRTAFFLSDGPSTQYKNKKMFLLMVNFLAKKLGVQRLRWIFSEPGHGKGAPDGVGGCLKRTADNLVSQGIDIPNFEVLILNLKKHCKGIKCLTIESSRIQDIDETLPLSLKPFKGTMAIRELTWSEGAQNVLQARKLCCLKCNESTTCSHFPLGLIQLPLPVEEVVQGSGSSSSLQVQVLKKDKKSETLGSISQQIESYLRMSLRPPADLRYFKPESVAPVKEPELAGVSSESNNNSISELIIDTRMEEEIKIAEAISKLKIKGGNLVNEVVEYSKNFVGNLVKSIRTYKEFDNVKKLLALVQPTLAAIKNNSMFPKEDFLMQKRKEID
ncbi:unnamed protein product [Brassicogethes aeneus]|uniref:Uncharacterized protein n=1 Tax=Brassicogethes aeneus TaxID=1431903 RepID=A0A9P0BIN3_BRAAE|nr:unnamed protein product [Brassicogethes aeneus]